MAGGTSWCVKVGFGGVGAGGPLTLHESRWPDQLRFFGGVQIWTKKGVVAFEFGTVFLDWELPGVADLPLAGVQFGGFAD